MHRNSYLQSMVVHVRAKKFDVYIGRGGPWGNPFIIGKHGTRRQVVEKYECWLQSQPQLLANLYQLRGKILGCYCAPHLCHGHVLAALANALSIKEACPAPQRPYSHYRPLLAMPSRPHSLRSAMRAAGLPQ
jgi:hypothetical protein